MHVIHFHVHDIFNHFCPKQCIMCHQLLLMFIKHWLGIFYIWSEHTAEIWLDILKDHHGMWSRDWYCSHLFLPHHCPLFWGSEQFSSALQKYSPQYNYIPVWCNPFSEMLSFIPLGSSISICCQRKDVYSKNFNKINSFDVHED